MLCKFKQGEGPDCPNPPDPPLYLISWRNSILGNKLRIDWKQLRLKILEKLRTASLNSEFTGSYKNV